uniref:Transmembrane protein 154 n=1 Tax=Moschus moschiferus TaxID=68415 RepID=A0A8C6DH81_MOSMO
DQSPRFEKIPFHCLDFVCVPTGEEDTELSGDMLPGTGGLDAESEALSTTAAATTETSITSINATLIEEDSDQLEFILIVLIPVILLSLLLLSAIFLVIYHKRKRNKQEPSSQGSQSVLQTRDPIFEEDTPSVMEIEMEELDKWMNSMNRNGMWCGITKVIFLYSIDNGVLKNQMLVIRICVPEAHQGELSKR